MYIMYHTTLVPGVCVYVMCAWCVCVCVSDVCVYVMCVPTGGRDRRGGPIITIYATDNTDLRPSNLGKILSYLSKVPE